MDSRRAESFSDGVFAVLFSSVLALVIFGLLAVYYMFEHLPDPADGPDDATSAPPAP
jgi:hypothetical protein